MTALRGGVMQYTTLGRTGLKVSVAGLGTGGSSLAGMRNGLSRDQSAALIRYIVDLGVNFIDSAANYGTEEVLGDALAQGPRDGVIVSTKCGMRDGGGLTRASDLVASLERSLRRLRTDYIDVYLLHAVKPDRYDHAVAELLPELERQRRLGKIRWIGLTESAPVDHEHIVVRRAAADGFWDVVMLAYNMTHQNAARTVFPVTRSNAIGTLMMVVVRRLFSRPALLAETMRQLAGEGKVPAWLGETTEPLQFLIHDGGATSVIDAAYRYVRHTPGVDVVLFGTGSPEHAAANVVSINSPPLPEADQAKLRELFGALLGVGIDPPDRS